MGCQEAVYQLTLCVLRNRRIVSVSFKYNRLVLHLTRKLRGFYKSVEAICCKAALVLLKFTNDILITIFDLIISCVYFELFWVMFFLQRLTTAALKCHKHKSSLKYVGAYLKPG